MLSKKSRLLSQEDQCLVLQPNLVKVLGKSETLFLQQVHYCLTQKNLGKEVRGVKWIYNSLSSWVEKIKILSERTLKRCIAKLKEIGILLVEKLSLKKHDRTNWYSINYERLEHIKNKQKKDDNLTDLKEDSNKAILALPPGQNGLMYKTEIPNRKDLNINLNKSEDCFMDEKDLKEAEEKREEGEALKKPTATDLLDIWNQETNQNVVLTKERAKHLMALVQRSFNTSKEEWRHYCKTLMSSDFLAGKTHQNFDLRLDWALKFQTVQKIKEKAYGVKDIPQNSDILLETVKDHIHRSCDPKEKEIRELLVEKFGLNTYKSWFETIHISPQNDLIIFKTESLFAKNYMERAFKYPLQDIMPIPFEII